MAPYFPADSLPVAPPFCPPPPRLSLRERSSPHRPPPRHRRHRTPPSSRHKGNSKPIPVTSKSSVSMATTSTTHKKPTSKRCALICSPPWRRSANLMWKTVTHPLSTSSHSSSAEKSRKLLSTQENRDRTPRMLKEPVLYASIGELAKQIQTKQLSPVG